ncbi:hypothetical protein [Segeticoccus rhizosphaerae]|uniref:hypothetical protein n=1 Tax=Segeticoccus rhizosphaerae TaxID=1104777 RepID=UPI001265389D|nr:hypothetical protein [Segeticoccus rhizosphaerae]
MPDHFRVPWAFDGDGVVIAGDDGMAGLRFTQAGMQVVSGQAAETVRWGEALRLQVKVPYSSLASYYLLEAFNLLSPGHGYHSAKVIEVQAMLKRRDASWQLGRPARFSWRLQLVLDDLFDVISERKRFEALADHALWEWVGTELVGTVPFWARALMYTDLVCLQRHLGGHGAYRKRIAAYLDAQVPPCPA